MADIDLQRQSRHALLDGFDQAGVLAVQAARVLIIGAGGLGCPAAMYLAASGVGEIHWVDGDCVDATNLARQTLFSPDDIGQPKVVAGKKKLQRLAPHTTIIDHQLFADPDFLNTTVPRVNVVLDCTDQWNIRQAINAACVLHHVPLVSGAAIEWSAQLLVFDPRSATDACYACVFDPSAVPEDAACGAYGVLGPMVGAVGCLQAAEALKILVGVGKKAGDKHSAGLQQMQKQKLTLLEMKTNTWQQLEITRNPDCPVCSQRDR
jgi:molybdopterin/thiamine biosynthesis adenylyltransferase